MVERVVSFFDLASSNWPVVVYTAATVEEFHAICFLPNLKRCIVMIPPKKPVTTRRSSICQGTVMPRTAHALCMRGDLASD